MEVTPFQRFILINLYDLWKEYGTSKVKPLESLIREYDNKDKNIRKAMKKLISEGLIDSDSYSTWLTKEGVRQMEAASRPDDSAVTREDKTPVNITASFLKNFEQAIGKSEVQSPEREMWLHGITQIGQNPILLKTLETALKATIDDKSS
ncbi:MAG: hypothetical protein R2568_00340 [Candidatus Scalindua sp.]|jgi:hypothetical protein|nr:hypothetical protein [Candidatus Scalindua sp.]MDV5165181.1 hypothetical protein [Candidatus Scalindua sp.]